ncbi:unnamed protein product [Chondrus crispus]|uniref:Uncharacterized protein n=1 Tax=Chondrus crispus TaxID=2769 RepID=R7Q8C3_CHOCR|nr:unnamed protein product [Chondrus crispus]CDF34792.1 unnamed protein product [Chondrus crispus]|eukprot:XP_005714611.1 unnamed protein product [Chondrus crispus]
MPSPSETTELVSETTNTATTAIATDTSAPAPETEKDGLPDWLKPGVSTGIHMGVRLVLLVLNTFLGCCALMQLVVPHFAVLFVLSLGLTASYFWFVYELGKIPEVAASEGGTQAGSGGAGEKKEKSSKDKEEVKKDL